MCDYYDEEMKLLQEKIQQKSDSKLDSNGGTITRERIWEEVSRTVRCENSGDVFYKNVLDQVTVYKSGRVELRLNSLTHNWVFQLERGFSGQNAEKVGCPNPPSHSGNSLLSARRCV